MKAVYALASLFLFSASAMAELTLIASPTRSEPSALTELQAHSRVLQTEGVFDPGERKALSALGETLLAQSLKLTVRTKGDALALEAWITERGLPIHIEENPSALAMATDSAQNSLEHFQWGMHNLGAPQRLDLDDLTSTQVKGKLGEDIGLTGAPAEGGKKVIVAVLDTGADVDHPNLKSQLLRKESECQALEKYKSCMKTGTPDSCAELAKVDSDGDGYPLDCTGWNITTGRNAITGIYGGPDITDDAGHGTHVSGIIGAALNGLGVRGVAQNISILPVKVIKTSPNSPIRPQSTDTEVPTPLERDLKWSAGFGDVIARGMLYAIRNHAQVINLSLAWPAGVDSMLMRRMVALAHAQGAIVVAAAGNDSADSRVFPCLYPDVVCVASHNPDGAFSHFSNYGSFVDVAAPGLDILSTWPLGKRTVNFTANNGFESKNGTSMATPFVVGLLARLLEAGYSSSEAYARLLIGARAQGVAVGIGAPAANAKYSRSGNADLAGAFRAVPQPLILENTKAPIKIQWDWHATRLPFRFDLRNYWNAATHVRIRARLLTAGGFPQTDATLAQTNWEFERLDSQAIASLESTLEIAESRLEGRLSLELTLETDQQNALGQPAHIFRIPVDISVPISRRNRDAMAQVLPIQGPVLSLGADLRSVTAFDGKPGLDYVAIEEGPKTSLTLLTEVPGSHYEVSASTQIDAVEGALLLIQRLDADQDGQSDYVFIYRLNPAIGKTTPAFRFQYYDRTLQPLKSISETGRVDYDNQSSVITERFQWLRITNQGHDFLAPTWIGLGTTPALEVPAFDPWDKTPSDPPRMRMYYLAPEGLHTVTPPESTYFIQILPIKPGSAAGPLDLITGKGEDYQLEYRLSSLDRGVLSHEQILKLDHYRMLAGIDNVIGTTLLNSRTLIKGTALSQPSIRGAQRTTTILQNSNGSWAGALDFNQAPSSRLDSVMQISGLFLGETRRGAFAQTHYDLQYNDLANGQVARTSLDRFSFLPAFIFARSFFPVTLEDSTQPQGDRMPGILIPSSLGVSDSTEVVVPRYNQNGDLQGLSRPAKFRMVGTDGCQDLGNPVTAASGAPSELVFFCGDHFLRVPLVD